MMSLLSASRARLRTDERDAGVAMLLSLLVILVLASLSVAIAGVALSQVKPTQLERKNAVTVSAAEAALDVGLARLRAATTYGAGDARKLPCTVSGQANSGSTGTSFAATLSYYRLDPTGQNATWRSTNKLICTAGSGTTDSSGTLTVPLYALLSAGTTTSIGANTSQGNRSVETVYQFNTSNANVAGGIIADYAYTNMCWDGGALTTGTALTLKTCNSSAATQLWSYRTDLSLYLNAADKCLSAASTVGALATLQPCLPTDYKQIWSYDDDGRFRGTSDGATTNGSCLTSPTAISVSVVNCNGDEYSPDARVGAGAAGNSEGKFGTTSQPQQLVNYAKFGRCVDVTNQDVNKTFMIGYPCKQVPQPSYNCWNQLWGFDPATKSLSTYAHPNGLPGCGSGNNQTYCLQAGSAGVQPTTGALVTTKACIANDVSQIWLSSGRTGDYTTSYTIVTGNGLCLTLSDNRGPGVGASDSLARWGSVTAETCSGALNQKWNAPPNLVDAGTKATRETTAG